MSDEHLMSWDEMQRLTLPPNTALLTPPGVVEVEVPSLAGGSPPQPDWLDDQFVASTAIEPIVIDPDANRAAAERVEYGPGPVRFLANLVAVNAVMEQIQLTRRRVEDKKRPA